MDVYSSSKTVRIARKGGEVVTLVVRRVRATAEVSIQSAADVRQGSIAGQNRFAMLKTRYALVGADGLRYEDTGESVAFAKSSEYPTLGPIASSEVFDALTELETLCILLLADGSPAEQVQTIAAASLDKARNALEALPAEAAARRESDEKN